MAMAGRMEQVPFYLIVPIHPCLPHPRRAENRRQLQRSTRGWGEEGLAHLPLVPMQQGRPLILQSMCNKPV